MAEAMILVFGLGLAGLVGFAIGRWWALSAGLLVGLAAAAIGVGTGTGAGDTPALFLAAVITAASSLGVVLRRRLSARAA